MNSDLALKYDARLPRYTSYPTAPHFTTAVDGATYDGWLVTLDASTPLSLYLHIAYCEEMCWFCGCHTKITRQYDIVKVYLDALMREIDLVAARLPGRFTVGHIHFGGGSPNIIRADDFTLLLRHLKSRFDLANDVEIAVELDPRATDKPYVKAMASAGVNRVSIGVQDFDPRVQKTVNRIQPYEQVSTVVAWLRECGINAISVDLMYGLPHQTCDTISRAIEQTMTLAPRRISLFGYAHVPWMRQHQRLVPEEALPGTIERWQQYQLAYERLRGYDFEPIGLDHFARPDDDMALALREGRLHRNFQGYTTDTAPTLIGLGASGIGAMPQGYVANETDIGSWRRTIEAGAWPIKRGVRLQGEDRLRRAVIERLMCYLEVDLAATCREHGAAEDHFAQEFASLADLEQDGGVSCKNGSIVRVTPESRLLVRVVAARFDQYLTTGQKRHSKAV